VAFYEGVFGLTVLDRSRGAASLGVADGTTLVELHERSGAAPVDRRGRLGLFHFAILLPDRLSLGRFLADVAGRGVVAGMADHAVSEAVYLSDPDGLGIEVYADRPRSEWRRTRGGELRMTTEALDVAGLLKLAGDTRFSGVPAGTVMGHVHLSVSDLNRAARFYRDGLGLQTTVSTYPGALFLAAGGYHHHLGLNTWSRGAPLAGPDDARLLEWTIALAAADVEAAAARLEAIGAEVTREFGAVKAVDPWGTPIGLQPA
jgi:catechol 2,3-dioxygenase